MQPEIQNLIDRWNNGDERAAETLYTTFRTAVLRLAFAIVGERESAEEIMQDALAYALMNTHHFDPERASFKTWLFTITISRSRDFLRKKRLPLLELLETWLDGGIPQLIDPAPLPESELMQNERQQAVWNAVQNLPRTQREALVLRYWNECTYHEIAAITACPVTTAQTRVLAAYAKLRAELQPAWQAENPAEEPTP